MTLQRRLALETEVIDHATDARTMIAHEADADPSYPNMRFPIATADVNRAIDFIETLGGAIHGAM